MPGFDVKAACDAVLSGLKPFQRDTVEHIDALFKRADDPVSRVLVADEVGMGKTLVAKGVVAKTAVLRHDLENDPLFKVVYVCSNSAIANQNLEKLSIDERGVDVMQAGESRLSMQHLVAYESEQETKLNGKYIQLIPLTPGTSFSLDSGGGIVQERALICAVLEECGVFPGLNAKLERLLEYRAKNSFADNLEAYRARVKAQGDEYLGQMREALASAEVDEKLGPKLEWVKGYVESDRRDDDVSAVARLRSVFAYISVGRLDPDLVIMDEFQRFRNLLDQDDESETGILTRRFLTGRSRDEGPIRVLLLSATPFKPYSTASEDEAFFGSEAQEDFLQVVGFLADEPWEKEGRGSGCPSHKLGEFRVVWDRYGVRLSEFAQSGFAALSAGPGESAADGSVRAGSLSSVRAAKDEAEKGLRNYVSRTERNAIEAYRDIVVDRSVSVAPETGDIESHLLASEFFKERGVGRNAPIEYSESCPFLLSYLKGYKLRDRLVKAPGCFPYIKESKKKAKLLWVSRSALDGYKELAVPNSRFKRLMADVFVTGASDGSDASSLLWVPASRPYYLPDEGPFVGVQGFSKTLIFSSWTMVPRMMSTLLSYEDERLSVNAAKAWQKTSFSYFGSSGEADEDASANGQNDDAKKKIPSGQLLFAPAAERGSALLLYPSVALADIVDFSSTCETTPISELRDKVRHEIGQRLAKALSGSKREERGDMRWYLKAALLLDKECCEDGERYVASLLTRFDEDECLSESAKRGVRLWAKVNDEAAESFGAVPRDLESTLAEMAIASPAVCAVRLLSRCNDYDRSGDDAHLALDMAYAFTRKMNTPASTLAVNGATRAAHAAGASHWRRVLWYCVNGNFQAVMDEYAHQIGYSKSARTMCDKIIGREVGAFKTPSMYTVHTRYDVDSLQSFRSDARLTSVKVKPMKMRTEFASAFLEDESGAKAGNHRDALRHAFNSPFRPFVLASTSVGQEGLDFHAYCRKIVHWNLPSNPVDLEQREGRVNRFKSLALRQNVAAHFNVPVPEGNGDVWQAMFEKAEDALCGDGGDRSGLIPYWGLNDYEDSSGEKTCAYDDDLRVERKAYLRRFGKDEERYKSLIDVLVRYRAVLGQPRQEELLRKLGTALTEDEMKELFMNLSPYSYEHQDYDFGRYSQ